MQQGYNWGYRKMSLRVKNRSNSLGAARDTDKKEKNKSLSYQ